MVTNVSAIIGIIQLFFLKITSTSSTAGIVDLLEQISVLFDIMPKILSEFIQLLQF